MNNIPVDHILNIALPIVLGAGIGFVTNVIAIRMLFRPLQEYRIFGLRVPFTPGIIPRQQGSLAKSIGRMVSGKLLSPEAVLAHLRNPDFQQSVSRALVDATEHSPFVGRASEFVRGIVGPEDIRGILSTLGESVGKIPLDKILSPGLIKRISRQMVENQFDQGVGPRIVMYVADLTRQYTAENRSLEGILTPEVRGSLGKLSETLYSPVTQFLTEWLRRPEVKRELIRRGTQVFGQVLNQLSSVQRFLISAGQYDRTMTERMPEIISDLLNTLDESLRNPDNKEKILAAVAELLERLSTTPLQQLEAHINKDIASLVEQGGIAALTAAKKERVGLRVQILLRRFRDSHGDVDLNRVLEFVTNRGIDEFFADFGHWFEAWFFLPGNLESFLQRIFDLVLRDSTALVQPQTGLSQTLSKVLEQTVPGMVQNLDIQSLVENRINDLDVLQVEELLLSIMAKHFKWINLFGGILGALIGALQLIIP